ncbi:MAG: hypothetical protein ACYSUQ_05210 [Planctomycetota bacterium]|jgi:hypothetical protein
MAVYGNRRRQRGHRVQGLQRKRGELVERPFDHLLDYDGMRRTHLKGREKVAKCYLVQTAAFNLGPIMRQLRGFGTPRHWADGLGRLLLRWVARLGPVRGLLTLSVRVLWPMLLSATIPPRAPHAA